MTLSFSLGKKKRGQRQRNENKKKMQAKRHREKKKRKRRVLAAKRRKDDTRAKTERERACARGRRQPGKKTDYSKPKKTTRREKKVVGIKGKGKHPPGHQEKAMKKGWVEKKKRKKPRHFRCP